MPAIEQQKNLRHILSRRARVAGSVGIPSAECPAREAISDLPGSGELLSEEAMAKAEKMRQRRKRGAIRDNRRPLEYAEMRRASSSRKRNSAWGISR